MIRTVADLLKLLADAEAIRINQAGIVHAPTIGAMYEGLSAKLLNKSLPAGLDLQIVSGFATDGQGGLSGQLDCMLVRGQGEAVPHTSLHKWPVQDIIAILEVKKTLYGTELADSYDQVRDVSRIFSSWVQNAKSDHTFDLNASFRVYAEVTGEVAPKADAWAHHREQHLDRHLILHTIMSDQMVPARIILGYGGYKTEAGLRQGFLDYMAGQVNKAGYGPSSIPNLIIAGGNSLVKLSGHPYRAPLDDTGYWPVMASTHTNPILMLLETIWTRLSYLAPLAPLFGEDLQVENLALLLSTKPAENPSQPGMWGWMYKSVSVSEKQLASHDEAYDWEPSELTARQFQLVEELCRKAEVDITDRDFVSFYGEGTGSVDSFVADLVATRLVARDGNLLKLTTTTCMCVIMPDGRYLAADNNTGRFERWINKSLLARSQPPRTDTERSRHEP